MGLFTPDAVVHDPGSPEPLKGREAIRKGFEGWFEAFPDAQIKFVHIVSKDDITATEMELTGTHTGPLVGPQGSIPPTNRRVTIHGAGFARLNSQHQIEEERRYLDTAAMMAQLGITPGS